MDSPLAMSRTELLTGRLAADSLERIRLMLETCMAEVRKHDDEIRRQRDVMTEEKSAARAEALRDLVLDAARKALTIDRRRKEGRS